MIDSTRRAFLGGALTITAASLLPLGVMTDTVPTLYGDLTHCDAAGLSALFNGTPFRTSDGFVGIADAGYLSRSKHLIRGPVVVESPKANLYVAGCYFVPGRGGSMVFKKRYSGQTVLQSCHWEGWTVRYGDDNITFTGNEDEANKNHIVDWPASFDRSAFLTQS